MVLSVMLCLASLSMLVRALTEKNAPVELIRSLFW